MSNFVDLINTLKNHGIIAYPTETVFGLGCDPYSEKALLALIKLKQRDIDKGLILIAPDLNLLLPFIDETSLTVAELNELKKSTKQPITWLVPAKKNISKLLIGKFASIAIRICKHPQVLELCRALNAPLVSTSANLQGKQPCINAREIINQFGENFPILEGIVNVTAKPSTIIDLKTKKIIRE